MVLVDPNGVIKFLEFKRPSGSLSEEQEEFMFWSIRHGVDHAVARSFDEALFALRTWGAIEPAIQGG